MPPAIPLVIGYLSASVITAGVGVAAMATLTNLAAWIIPTVFFVSFVGSGYLASKAFGPKAPKNAGALGGGIQTNFRDPAALRRLIYGRQKVGGPLVFIHSSGGATNDILHLIIAVAGHEIQGVEQLFFGSEALTWDSSTGEVGGRFAGFARIRVFTGSSTQAASSELIAECPDVWTSAHQLRGIAYLYVRLKYSSTVFTEGIPTVTAIVQGRKIYDPRTGTTAYSTNPALCLRDYLTDHALGLGVDASEIDDASLIAAANMCDESVSLASGGTESRYTCNTLIDSSTRPEDVIGQLLSASGGILTYSGGLWTHHAAGWRAPTLTLTADHLSGPISISTKLSARDRCNGIKGTFVSEANQWQVGDYPSVVNATYLGQDNGVRSWRDIPLPCTLTASMAQRLAKIELEKSRQEISCTLICNLNAIGLRCGDVVNVSLDRYGWSAKPFEVTAWTFVQDGEPAALMISLSLRETASGVYDWNNGEETTVDLAPNTTLPNSYTTSAPSNLSLSGTASIQADGTVLSRLIASWSVPTSVFWHGSGTRQVLEYQANGDSGWTPWTTVPGDTNSATLSGVIPGASYRFRIRSENEAGMSSEWMVSGYFGGVGDTTAPSQPYSLVASGIVQGIRVTWTNPTDPDFDHIEIYESATSLPAPNSGTNPSFSLKSDSFTRSNLDIGLTRYYWIRSADHSGNKSAWSGPVSAMAQAVDVSYISGKLGTSLFDSSIRPVEIVSALPSSANFQGRVVLLTTNNKIYRWTTAATTGTADWSCASDGADITGGSITGDKLTAGTITGDKLAARSILAKNMVLSNADSILPDPGFYDTANSWGWTEDSVIYSASGTQSDQPYRFTFCQSSGGGERDYFSPQIPVEQGASYRVKLRLFVSTGFSGWIGLSIHVPNQAWFVVYPYQFVGWLDSGNYPILNGSGMSFGVWNEYHAVFTKTTAGLPYIQTRVRYASTAGYFAFSYEIVRANDASLIVDGSITANAIAANSITAEKVGANQIISSEANLGNAVVTNAKIHALAVDTIKIADQAVTIPVSAFSSSASLSTSFSTIISCAINSSGAPILVGFSFSTAIADFQSFDVQLLVNGSILFTQSKIAGFDVIDSSVRQPYSYNYVHTPGVGSFTYSVEVKRSGGSSPAENITMYLLETKK